MAVLHLPRRHVGQPQGLLRSARDDALFLYCGGSIGAQPGTSLDAGIPDLISGALCEPRYTADPVVAATEMGVGPNINGYQRGYSWLPASIPLRRAVTIGTQNGANQNLTFVWYGWIASITSSNSYINFFNKMGQATAGNNGTWSLRRNFSIVDAVSFLVTTAGAAVVYSAPAGSLPRNSFNCVIVRIQNDAINIFSNGSLVLEASFTQPVTGSGALNERIRLGSDSYNYNNYTGNIPLLAGVYQGAFTDGDVARVMQDPYSLIAARTRQIHFDLGMSGGNLLRRRALLWYGSDLKQITDAQEGQGLKPLVLLNGGVQERVTSEGSPIIWDGSQLRTLDTVTEELII